MKGSFLWIIALSVIIGAYCVITNRGKSDKTHSPSKSAQILKDALPAGTEYRVLSFEGASGSMEEIVAEFDKHIMQKVILRIGHQPHTPFVSLRVMLDLKDYYEGIQDRNAGDLSRLEGLYQKISSLYSEFLMIFEKSQKYEMAFKEKHKEALAWFEKKFFPAEMKPLSFEHPIQLYRYLGQTNQQDPLTEKKRLVLTKAGVVLAEEADDKIMAARFWHMLAVRSFPRYFELVDDHMEGEYWGIQATIALEALFGTADQISWANSDAHILSEAVQAAAAAWGRLDGEPQKILGNFFAGLCRQYPKAREISAANDQGKKILDGFYKRFS